MATSKPPPKTPPRPATKAQVASVSSKGAGTKAKAPDAPKPKDPRQTRPPGQMARPDQKNRHTRKQGKPPGKSTPIGPRAANGQHAELVLETKYVELTPLVLEGFLTALALSGNVTQVCSQFKISRTMVLRLKREDPEFATRFNQAQTDAFQGWEDEVARRAFQGYQKPVFQMGMEVGRVTEYSDKLAEMMIRANKPEKYTPRTQATVAHAGAIGIKYSELSIEELNREITKNAGMLGLLDVTRAEYNRMMGRPVDSDPDDPVGSGGTDSPTESPE